LKDKTLRPVAADFDPITKCLAFFRYRLSNGQGMDG